MNNFEFCNPTRIIFGKDTHRSVGKLLAGVQGKVLLHYGGGSIKKTGLYDQIVASLKAENIDFIELGGVQSNPRLSLVREGIRLCREHQVKFILAVGGGSVIDSAKAIGVGVPYEGDVWDFYTRKAEPKETIPVGVVLTIPAAGSESSNSSVITNEDGWYKRPLDHPILYPKFAILNPELTYTIPPYHTACGIADIMAHVMERYFTRTPHTDFTDRLCEATLKTVINNARIVMEKPDDYDARAEIMWAAAIAHNGLLGTGREEDWGSHMIEHEISGIYDVAHGAGLAVVFPAWMQYVYKTDLGRFVQFAVRVWDVDFAFGEMERIALEGIRRLKVFFREIGLPVTLKELGVEEDRLEEIAQKGTEFGPLGHFHKLEREDIVAILKMAR